MSTLPTRLRPPARRPGRQRSRRPADYLQAVADVAQATVSGVDPGEVYRLIVRQARNLIGAASATIVTLAPDATGVTIRAADGASAERLELGARVPVKGTLGEEVVRTGITLVVAGADSAAEPYRSVLLRFNLGPAMCVPLIARRQVFGAMSVAYAPGSPPFRATDVALVEAFAGQAAIALEFTRLRDELHGLAVVDERERIARELHDGAIQVLFGLGLELQALSTWPEVASTNSRVDAVVGRIDGVISDLRHYIASLRPSVLEGLHTEPTPGRVSRAPSASSPVPNQREGKSSRAFTDRLNAIGDINQAILDGLDVETVFHRLSHSARALVDAESAIISTLRAGDRNTLVLRALVLRDKDVPRTERIHPDDLFDVDDTVLAHPVRTGQSFVVEDVQCTDDPSLQRIRQLGIGAAVAVPLAVQGRVFGALAVCRGVGQPPFQPADVRLMETFGTQAAIALEYRRARDELNRLAVLNERERIARELHEGVIQTLFGAGMDLQALATSIDDPPTSQRLTNAVDGVDGVIRDLRNYVFGQRPGILADRHVDRALRDLAAEFARRTGVQPAVEIDADVAARLAGATATDVVQIAREALSNVARHAQAHACRVTLRRENENAILEVSDDGRGVGPESGRTNGHGLNNMRGRAVALGGVLLVIEGLHGRGTTLRASVPI
jgi:signal transduction histidine kinase